MAEYLSPGVYVEEYDDSPRSIEGVGTSTAGFVGMAVKGLRPMPVRQPRMKGYFMRERRTKGSGGTAYRFIWNR